MKLFLCASVFICLAAAVTSISEGLQSLKDKRIKAIEDCKKEKSGISEEDWGVVKIRDEPKNDVQHCIMYCVYEKMGIVKDGKLNNEEINKVTLIRHGHNQTLFQEEDYLSKTCQKSVENSYSKITNKCYIPNAYHACVPKKRAERVANAQKQKEKFEAMSIMT
uniref:Odorant binding protein n=1 Tax=Paracoccus marginatus TaxID=252483 RepID=A0AA51WAH7_9HEMI|nr:odorant binding protein [Paracoccus marginatus]